MTTPWLLGGLLASVLTITYTSSCKNTGNTTLLENGASDGGSANAVKDPWLCAQDERFSTCATQPWGRTRSKLPHYASQALGANLNYESIHFSQYSRPNDDTRAAANPIAALARMRKVSESQLTSTILRQDSDHHYLDRSGCVKAALELRDADAAAYEVSAVTFAIAAHAASPSNYKVAFSNILEATTAELVNAAAQGNFSLEVSLTNTGRLPGSRYSSDLVPNKVNSINHATVTAELPAGQYEGQMWIDGGRRWMVCKTKFSLPLDESTAINCERFKFPPLFHMRTNTRLAIDFEASGKPARWKQPDLGEPHNCKALETHGDTDKLSPDSKFAYLLRQVKVGRSETCLSCHTIDNEVGIPGLFCKSKGDDSPFDPYGRPKEVVEVAPSIVHYFVNQTDESVPKWDHKDSWGSEIEVMRSHFRTLLRSYCDELLVDVATRDVNNPVERVPAHTVIHDFIKPFLPAVNGQPVTREQICTKFKASN